MVGRGPSLRTTDPSIPVFLDRAVSRALATDPGERFDTAAAFAEALTTGAALPGKCTVSSGEERAEIASFLGVDVGAEEKRVARLACAGGSNVSRNHARYHGEQTCRSAARVAGGGKGCFWGCLGLGDCDVVCDFDAIHMNAHNLPVVDEAKCTACGDCVEVCPKDLFSLHEESHRLWVACSSQEAGDEILEDCEENREKDRF